METINPALNYFLGYVGALITMKALINLIFGNGCIVGELAQR